MTHEEILDGLIEEVKTLQYRVGGAEFIIKSLVQKMSPEELTAVEIEIKEAISNYGSNSAVGEVMHNSLRLLGK